MCFFENGGAIDFTQFHTRAGWEYSLLRCVCRLCVHAPKKVDPTDRLMLLRAPGGLPL